MKSVLISIQPKWCELIASGKKTIEVRKTRPKIQTPFKCYIYESRNGGHRCKHCKEKDDCYYYAPKNVGCYNGRARIIGEFVCDEVREINKCVKALSNSLYGFETGSLEESCLTEKEIDDYLNGEKGYGWHISDLKIYDKPRELSEFFTPMGKRPSYMLERPPQSWCYVEWKP